MYRRVELTNVPFSVFFFCLLLNLVQDNRKVANLYKATGRLKLRVKSTTAVYYAIVGTGPREFVWNDQARVMVRDQFIFL